MVVEWDHVCMGFVSFIDFESFPSLERIEGSA